MGKCSGSVVPLCGSHVSIHLASDSQSPTSATPVGPARLAAERDRDTGIGAVAMTTSARRGQVPRVPRTHCRPDRRTRHRGRVRSGR
jgi:hypothetical protein